MIVHDLLHSKIQTELSECMGPLLTVEGRSSVEQCGRTLHVCCCIVTDGILQIHDASGYGRKGFVCRAQSAAQILRATHPGDVMGCCVRQHSYSLQAVAVGDDVRARSCRYTESIRSMKRAKAKDCMHLRNA